ncbi:hypothetical protein, partial [Salmonella enterica]
TILAIMFYTFTFTGSAYSSTSINEEKCIRIYSYLSSDLGVSVGIMVKEAKGKQVDIIINYLDSKGIPAMAKGKCIFDGDNIIISQPKINDNNTD